MKRRRRRKGAEEHPWPPSSSSFFFSWFKTLDPSFLTQTPSFLLFLPLSQIDDIRQTLQEPDTYMLFRTRPVFPSTALHPQFHIDLRQKKPNCRLVVTLWFLRCAITRRHQNETSDEQEGVSVRRNKKKNPQIFDV